MILLQNPNVPTSLNPVEIDSAIIDIKTELESGLTWLTNGYGRAFKNLDITNGERVYFPEVYLGKQNGSYRYTNISPDNDKQGQCFFYVRRETISEYQTGMYSFLNYDVALIFSVNMELINATLTETDVFQQVLVAQVRDVLTRQILGKSYVLKVNTVEFLFEDVFREFNLSEQSTMEKSPLSHFRFNISVKMPETCPSPSIVPPVTTCYSLLLDGVNMYINCGNNTAFDLNSTDSFSVSAWIKKTGGIYFPILQKLETISNLNVTGYRLYIGTTNEIVFNLIGGNSTNRLTVFTPPIMDNVWQNIIVTYNGNEQASGVNIYINGIFQPLTIFIDSYIGTLINTQILTLGGQPTPINPLYGTGNIASVRMWNAELTSGETLTEYNNGLNPASVQTSNLILNTNINNANFDGSDWQIPDLTSITSGYTSVNMETGDRVEECPVVIPVVPCVVGSTFSTPFDGVNSYIVTKVLLSDYDLEGTDKFTFSFYIKPDVLQEGDIINKFAGYSPTLAKGYFIRLTSLGEIRFGMHNDINRVDVKSPPVIVSGLWQHVVVSNDGSASASGVKIYIDGIQQANTVIQNNLSGSINNTLEVLKLGANTTNSRYYSGLLDDVKMWNLELSPTEAECPTDLYPLNLFFYNKMGELSLFGFTNRHYPDDSGLTFGYSSQNMGFGDISTDTIN